MSDRRLRCASIEEAVFPRLGDRAARFVFPSKAAAIFWTKRAALRSGAVRADRFLGWDEFRDRVAGVAGGTVDPAIRSLWAAHALATNEREPFLASLIPADRRGSWQGYVDFVASLLPSLDRATTERVGRASGAKGAEAAIFADLAALGSRYAAFLAANALAEPAWPRPLFPEAGARYLILEPELIEDFEAHREALEAEAAVEFTAIDAAASPPDPIAFDTGYDELRAALCWLRSSLEGGARPDELCLTVAGLDAARPWLLRLADSMGVPIALKSGTALAATPGGRLFAEIAACARSDYDFASVRALLADRFPPWKSPELARALLKLGVDYHAYAPWTEGERRIDQWERTFQAIGDRADSLVVAFYRDFRKETHRIAKARGFTALAQAFRIFEQGFFREEGWDGEASRALSRALGLLDTLADAERRYGLDVGPALPLFLSALARVRYVPAKAEGVPVYDYRVSALVAPAKHWVAGCTQDGASVRYARGASLRDDLRRSASFATADATAAFARAYSRSGSEVRFSYAREGFEGWAPPLAWFGGRSRRPTRDDFLADPRAAERSLWKAGDPGEGATFPERMVAAAERFARGSGEPADDALSADAAERANALLRPGSRDDPPRGETGSRALSYLGPYDIGTYSRCPRAWLLRNLLALREKPLGPDFFDARFEGTLLHAAARYAWESLAEAGVARLGLVEDPAAVARRACERAVAELRRREGPFVATMAAAALGVTSRAIGRMLEHERTRHPRRSVGRVEVGIGRDEPTYRLYGRLDRLADEEGHQVIVDYKRSANRSRAEFYADGRGLIADPQMAAYVRLAERDGVPVRSCSLWAMVPAKEISVIADADTTSKGKPCKDREAFESDLAAFDAMASRAAVGIAARDFPKDGAKDGACPSCEVRAICRAAYATER